MLITSEHLKGACPGQINLFNETFPVGAEFNRINWDLALSVGLQIDWMNKFLDVSARKIYIKATASDLKIYKEAITSARKIYEETEAPALKIYREATVPSWNVFLEETDSAWKVYKEVIALAQKIYEKARELALFNALEEQFKGIK